MRGSIHGFEFGVDLLFDIGKQGRLNVLDLAVLVRRSSERQSTTPDPAFLRPPVGATSGGGGTVGPFTLQYWLPQRGLWVNGIQLLVVPAGCNVVLIDEQAESLVLVSTEHVSLDFDSDAMSLGTNDPSPLDVWSVLLRQAFARSERVASFIASSAHPSFKPLPAHKSVRGTNFAPGIDSWCFLQVSNGRPQLQCVVLVRLSASSRKIVGEPVWRRAPPFVAAHVSGTSFGAYDVLYDIEKGALWVNGTRQSAHERHNVYLFREEEGSLRSAGTLAVDPDPRAMPAWREVVKSSALFRALI